MWTEGLSIPLVWTNGSAMLFSELRKNHDTASTWIFWNYTGPNVGQLVIKACVEMSAELQQCVSLFFGEMMTEAK